MQNSTYSEKGTLGLNNYGLWFAFDARSARTIFSKTNFCISLVTDKINEGGGRVRGHFIPLVLFFIFLM